MITTVSIPEFNALTRVHELIAEGICLDTIKTVVTKEIAEDLIENMSPNQRALNARTVRKYATVMKSGKWYPYTMDGIVIGKDGTVLNSNHRLHAALEAGFNWPARITFNVDPEQFLYMDQARKRETKDFLECKNSTDVAACGRMLCALEYGNTPLPSVVQSKISANDNVPDTLNTEYCRANQSYILTLVEKGVSMYIATGQKGGGKAIYSFFIGLLEYLGYAEDTINDFVNDFCANAPKTRTVTACRTTITRSNSKTRIKTLGILLMGFDYYLRNENTDMFNKGSIYIKKYDEKLKNIREKEKAAPTD